MSYVHNTGSFATNVIAAEPHISLTSFAVADILLLQWMPESSTGYTPPQIDSGKLITSGRTTAGALKVLRAPGTKLVWHDLAFVCSAQQVALLEALMQSNAPIQVADTISGVGAQCAVIAADKYKSLYSGTAEFLMQFSLWQI
jgi:hypothetical protein